MPLMTRRSFARSMPRTSVGRCELFLPPIDDVEVVVGEPAPLLLGFAFELLPVPLDSIPVHHTTLRIFVFFALYGPISTMHRCARGSPRRPCGEKAQLAALVKRGWI
jgi:hypothetical protein